MNVFLIFAVVVMESCFMFLTIIDNFREDDMNELSCNLELLSFRNINN